MKRHRLAPLMGLTMFGIASLGVSQQSPRPAQSRNAFTFFVILWGET